ncbi:MAG: uroporphyrinogen-III C-methyltransferase [Alphaproteobacteria bacterium]|nr:uroporphyrinogen-III C-methyltransferase [Alphaproteobacteria bacterium]
MVGRVYLVGAGPGAADMLTVRAQRVLQGADVVVFDRLVSPEILDQVPRGAMRIDVGKRPQHHAVPQEEINDMLVRLATAGRTVVRLKGGDPFTFGRGSEEARHLMRAGIATEVIAGVTSASACAAAVGIPLTHRGLASGVRYVAGHCRNDGNLDYDWRGLADPDTTLVVYMGMAQIGAIAVRLVEAGLSPETPAAAIVNGTTPRQRHCIATLATIANRARPYQGQGPVLFIIGRVVGLAPTLDLSLPSQPGARACHASAD